MAAQNPHTHVLINHMVVIVYNGGSTQEQGCAGLTAGDHVGVNWYEVDARVDDRWILHHSSHLGWMSGRSSKYISWYLLC
jgi:hypothetical protein